MSAEAVSGSAPAPVRAPPSRLFYWSVRREIWEHRAVYVAPIAAAGVGLFGALLGSFRVPHAIRLLAAHAPKASAAAVEIPFDLVAFAALVTGLAFAVFYSLGALHAERRDRSLLFWKSLPVSDATTVLSKAFIPLVVTPAVILGVTVAAHVVLIAWDTLVVALSGQDPRLLWDHLPIPFIWVSEARGLILLAIWYAPVCGWLMLVSGWARRMPALWALGPPLAICVLERIALGRKDAFNLLRHRIGDGFTEVFTVGGTWKTHVSRMADLNPLPFFSHAEVWIGVLFAALLLALAVRIRRAADPI